MDNVQPSLFDPPPIKPRTITDIAQAHADQLSSEFLEWLPENLHVWTAFEKEVHRVIQRGYSHYSAYTIVEFLRHHSAVQEAGGEWKINNNMRPYLSRLFDLAHPELAGMFKYRVTTKERGL